MICKRCIVILTAILLFNCSKDNLQDKRTKLFSILDSELTGIDFKNGIENTLKLNILNYLYFYNGSGVAASDFNNDGLIDLYFPANQTADKLYLNQGSFTFKELTLLSGIDNSSGWTTGVTTVDINNDGLQDIYISKAASIFESSGDHNLLYINKGIQNGIPTFREAAAEYGLDFSGYSTQAVFFDYDRDDDLDMFLLNHSVHPNSNYGHGNNRLQIDSLSGDKLYRNDSGKFVDVSSEAGIYQGKIGYGLGVSVGDINNDGFADLYIGNDFFENDYLYINNKDGTFGDINAKNTYKLGHTTHFSMGNDLVDINNDGLNDIISVDMLPEDLKTYKTSGLEHNFQIYRNYLNNGYNPQYMQNTLHLNNGLDNAFSETAFLSGIAATEWSWAPLVADFDNDGYKDIHITNGILGATNDMDFISFIANEKIQSKLNKGMDSADLDFIKALPSKRTTNYFFKNNTDNTFQNTTAEWSDSGPSYSNGATYADLDNDGDLDIVINNVNETALVLRNNSEKFPGRNNYLKIKFKGSQGNKQGIGAKVRVYADSLTMYQENYTTRGYLSSVPPVLYFGVERNEVIDSVQVIWPSGNEQIVKNIASNQQITINHAESEDTYQSYDKWPSYLMNSAPLFTYTHKDQPTVEFNRDPLIPFASTNLGPEISVADVNNDNRDDLFIGGSKRQQSVLFLQAKDGSFAQNNTGDILAASINEDVSQVFFDADKDGNQDLMVVSGGNEYRNGKQLNPRLYFNRNGKFVHDSGQFTNIEINASKVEAIDFDNDGNLDLCITSNMVPWKFGVSPKHYFFRNDGNGKFEDITSSFAPGFDTIGNIQDMTWIDLNSDSYKDLIVVGNWMPVSVYINDGAKLALQKNDGLTYTNGWMNVVKANDFDKDGDIDLVVGNWGLNSRLAASKEHPLNLYANDFDDNGSVEPVVTYFFQGEETPFASKDELVKQMPFINKKYLSYSDFANAKIEDLFPAEKRKTALKKQVYELASCYFENLGNNTFKKHKLPFKAQVSSIFDIFVDDFNKDSFMDLLLVGNNFEISTQLGRLDGSHGVLLLNDQKGFFVTKNRQLFDVSGAARDIGKIKVNDEFYYIVTRNNDSPVFLKLKKN